MNRKLYLSWAAANKESVSLAEELSYHCEKEYVTFSVEVERLRNEQDKERI